MNLSKKSPKRAWFKLSNFGVQIVVGSPENFVRWKELCKDKERQQSPCDQSNGPNDLLIIMRCHDDFPLSLNFSHYNSVPLQNGQPLLKWRFQACHYLTVIAMYECHIDAINKEKIAFLFRPDNVVCDSVWKGLLFWRLITPYASFALPAERIFQADGDVQCYK